jgi:hypothetical protein
MLSDTATPEVPGVAAGSSFCAGVVAGSAVAAAVMVLVWVLVLKL